MASYAIEGRLPVILCDFDGTITEKDVIQMIMEAFAPPVWREIVHQILDTRTLSIRDGVTKLFSLIPGAKKDEIVRFVKANVRLREGFPAFLDFCQAHGIPFLVVSGGVDFFIDPVLKPFANRLDMFYNRAVFEPDRIALEFPYLDENCEPCGQCACCKLGILHRYPPDRYYRIAVGDSLTDLAMAREADWVFARDRLISYAEEAGIAVTRFETFGDIQSHLTQTLTETCHAG